MPSGSNIIRVRLPAVSNNELSGVKSDLKALRIHSLPVDATSLPPFPPLPSAPSVLIKSLPSPPTPEQHKILLYRNIGAIPPQRQNRHKTKIKKKYIRPEKGSKGQKYIRPKKGSKGKAHTPPPKGQKFIRPKKGSKGQPHIPLLSSSKPSPLIIRSNNRLKDSAPANQFRRGRVSMSTAATLPTPTRPPGQFHRRESSQHHPYLNKHTSQPRVTPSTHTGVPLYNPHQGWWGSQQNQAVPRLKDDWTTWNELAIRLGDLPACTRTCDLWTAFSSQGCIDYIELYEDISRKRTERGIIKFK